MNLYFVSQSDVNGESLDLFVVASDPREAARLAHQHFDVDPIQDLDRSPTVWLVPASPNWPNSGVISWDKMEATEVQP